MDTEPIPAQRDPEWRHLAILAFDIMRFSRFTDVERNRIAVGFRNAIQHSFTRTDMEPVWRERVFEQNAGDGIVTGFPDRHLRDIIGKIPPVLQDELRELHRESGLNVRMRLGVSVGPVKRLHDERIDIAPNQPIIDACRITDCKPTRLLLENSDDEVTYLAVAVTPAVVATAVKPDPVWVKPSQFARVPVAIEDKGYESEAFLHVPAPSGALLQFGLVNLHGTSRSEDEPDAHLEDRVERGEARFPSVMDVRTDDGMANQIRSVGRDVRDESVKASGQAIAAGAGSRVHQDRSQQDERYQDRSVRQAGRDIVTSGRDAVVHNRGGDDRHGLRPFWKGDER